MPHSSRTHTLHYSKLLSLPVVGKMLYALETFLVMKELLFHVWMARRETKESIRLLGTLSQHAKLIICTTDRFGYTLRYLRVPILLDISRTFLKKDPYITMWSLVFSSSVTKRTKDVCGNVIPSNIPITRNILIPYHEAFDVKADFVLQTAKALSKQKQKVYIVAYEYPVWILTYLFRKMFGLYETSIPDLGQFISVIPYITPLPNISPLPTRVKIFNRFVGNYFTFFFTWFLYKPIVWCFDHQDATLVRFAKGKVITVYDCVDYISSMDPKVKQYTLYNEAKLITLVDYFFVNSYVLARAKKHIRSASLVVPQGFDIDSFAKPLAEEKKKKISNRMRAIPSPRVGYVGNLTYRLDFSLLFDLSKRMPHVSFVLMGQYLPILSEDQTEETIFHLERLQQCHNVYILSSSTRLEVKETLKYFDVGMIPYNTSDDYNRYCYPMKTFEYFYMGKPVVSTPIEELKRFPKYVRFGKTIGQWEKLIKDSFTHQLNKSERREMRWLAVSNSWDMKTKKILRHVMG